MKASNNNLATATNKNYLENPLKNDFPILMEPHNKKRLAFLDNASSTQKPKDVLERLNHYYTHEHSNVHRGVYFLSQQATMAYEAVREKVAKFINSPTEKEVIFTSGTTDAINLVAYSYGLNEFKPGDEIILTYLEHHSNIVPWQIIAEKTGAKIQAVRILENGTLDLDHFHSLISNKTKFVSAVYVSNSLGTINPIREMITAAHKVGAKVLIDAAQAVLHFKVDVQELDADFLTFSGHKLVGPTGIGVLYGKKEILSQMAPFKGGGDMILNVSFEKTIYNEIPHRFEAGTPHIAGVIGLGAAVDYLNKIGFEQIEAIEKTLQQELFEVLKSKPFVRIIGPGANPNERVGVFSFTIDKFHPHDVGSIVDEYGVAVRVGHHCTQPIMTFFKIPATVRASLAFYNDHEDIHQLGYALDQVFSIMEKKS